MEWILLGIAVLVVVLWRAARQPAVPAPPPRGAHLTAVPAAAAGAVTAEVVRRATDPDNPDGAFMDGYVAGRYTERWQNPTSAQEGRRSAPADEEETDRFSTGDDDDVGDDESWDDW
jgi:hypothetical protein